MPLIAICQYLTFWSLLGATLFSMFVGVVFRSGIVYSARKRDGTLKDKIPLRGILIMVGFLLAIIGFLLGANYFGLRSELQVFSFGQLIGLNFVLYLILFLFDTLFIDGFVLAHWRPAILRIPEEMDAQSMRRHMLRSLPAGMAFGMLIAFVSSVISFFIWLR